MTSAPSAVSEQRRLRRVITGRTNEKIKALQILRFVAAGMVVFHHAQAYAHQIVPGQAWWMGRVSGVGAAGVDIFFVLSGAIIYRTAFGGEKPALAPDFLRRRLLRIAPLYYLTSLAWLPICGLVGWPTSVAGVFTSLTFWPVWSDITYPVNSIGWTLCFEMLFYVGTAAVVSSRRSAPVLALLYAGFWIAREKTGLPVFQFLGNPIILEFVMGVAVAACFGTNRPTPRPVALLLIILGGAALIALCLPPGAEDAKFTLHGTFSLVRVVVWGIPSAIMLIGALAIEPQLGGQWLRWPVFLGDASFAIYLVHWPIIVTLAWPLTGTSFANVNVVAALLLIAGIGGGAAVYSRVEGPLNAATKSAWLRLAPVPRWRQSRPI